MLLILLRARRALADRFTADGPVVIGRAVKSARQMRIGDPSLTPTGARLGALQLRVALSRIGRAR